MGGQARARVGELDRAGLSCPRSAEHKQGHDVGPRGGPSTRGPARAGPVSCARYTARRSCRHRQAATRAFVHEFLPWVSGIDARESTMITARSATETSSDRRSSCRHARRDEVKAFLIDFFRLPLRALYFSSRCPRRWRTARRAACWAASQDARRSRLAFRARGGD